MTLLNLLIRCKFMKPHPQNQTHPSARILHHALLNLLKLTAADVDVSDRHRRRPCPPSSVTPRAPRRPSPCSTLFQLLVRVFRQKVIGREYFQGIFGLLFLQP